MFIDGCTMAPMYSWAWSIQGREMSSRRRLMSGNSATGGRFLSWLTYEVADDLEEAVPKDWLWYGRHVKIVDGSTLQTPDTEANQEEWPLP
jgi:hypothetical protein